ARGGEPRFPPPPPPPPPRRPPPAAPGGGAAAPGGGGGAGGGAPPPAPPPGGAPAAPRGRGRGGRGRAPPRRVRPPRPAAPPPGLLAQQIRGRRELLLLKKNFDVFTNPNAHALLEALDPQEIVLFGVATDVCNDAAIRGLLLRGRAVTFVEDAARGLDEERTT